MPDRRGVQRHELQPEDHRRALVRRRRQRRDSRGRVHVRQGPERPRHARGLDDRRRPGGERELRRRPWRRRGPRRGAPRSASCLQGVLGPGQVWRRRRPRGHRRRHQRWRGRAVALAGLPRRDPGDAARRGERGHRRILRR